MNATKTFRCTQKSRGCEEFGPSCLTYTETVHTSGLVECRVSGSSDGVWVDTRSTRQHGVLDLEAVTAARLASGWHVVSA